MASIIASGDWWRLEGDGTLYIYCVGSMLGRRWNSYVSRITAVDIASSVTSISINAFQDCINLTHVTIPSGATFIAMEAFRGCSGLASITIPSSVTSIGDYAFYGCKALTSITIPDGVTNIGNYMFCGCSGLTSITIPSSVTSIKESAFSGCSGLASITIPSSVTSIGYGAFSGCSGLTSITIPDGVTNIQGSTFYKCSALTSVAIPDSVTSIEANAFYYCTRLSDIYYGGTEAQWGAVTIGDNNGKLASAAIHYNYVPPAPTYTVTFDANGGTGNMSAQTFTAGTAQELTANAFTRTGYMFGGWNTAADGSGTAYADGASYTANADITLYAQWTQVVLSSIAVTTPPAKTAYTAGETFDPSGMVVTATYSDASTAAVTGYDYKETPLTLSDTSIGIGYFENGVYAETAVTITVTEPEPEPVPTANRITIQIAKRNGGALTFSKNAVEQLEYVQSTSFDGKDVQADEFSAVIRQTAPNWLSNWNGVNRACAVVLSIATRNGTLLRTEKYYFKELRRVGKYDFELTAQSPLGRLTDDFPGGLYSAASLPDVIKAVIGNAIPETDYSINPLLSKVRVYGWIPYQERRTTLHQLALAYGFIIRRDENNNLYFTFPDTDTDNAYAIPDNAIFTGGSVDYSVGRTYYRADITAYEYLKQETEAQTLFDNTGGAPADKLIVRFDSPMFHLHAVNLTVSRSGVNYAEVSGSGQLTGKAYTKIESVISVEGDADADPQHTLSVSNIPMITSLNAASVGERLLNYYNAPAVVNMDILRTSQRSGDYVSFTDPFGDPQTGYITALSGSITSIDRASASIACEYTPSWDTDYDAVMVLTKETEVTDNNTWTVPEYLDGKRIRVVLIGGGTGGESGQHGTDSGGQGGNGGLPGAGGKVWDSAKALDEKFIVHAGEEFTYQCGTGGLGGYSSDELSGGSYTTELGSDGTASTFERQLSNIYFSSADGSSSNIGFYDVIGEVLYAAPGTYSGVSGGAATTGSEDTQENDKAKVQQGSVPEWLNVTTHSVSLPQEWDGLELVSNIPILFRSWDSGGSGDGDKFHQYAGDGEIYEWAYGGIGGGAAVGGGGGFGSDAMYSSKGGDGGNGADAAGIFPVIRYGGGGNGGHGGGEGGAGGRAHFYVTGDNDPTEPVDGVPGSGGDGSAGQNGGDGCILIYYNAPDT